MGLVTSYARLVRCPTTLMLMVVFLGILILSCTVKRGDRQQVIRANHHQADSLNKENKILQREIDLNAATIDSLAREYTILMKYRENLIRINKMKYSYKRRSY